MGKKLIVCEKPSLAASVCKGIQLLGERGTKKDNHVTEFPSYVVVPAFGHLFGLYDIEDYDQLPKWSYAFDKLPFVKAPADYKFKLNSDGPNQKKGGIKKQFETIKKLVQSKAIDSIINCGDSDREGEIIVRIILDQAGNHKPVYRLWLPDQVETTIADALKHLEPDSKYDLLAAEGYARTFIDWLYGMNLSRYSSKYTRGGVYRVGRVMSAVAYEICQRDRQIKNFKPETYYVVQSEEETKGEKITLCVKRKFAKEELEEAKKLAEKLNGHEAVVTNVSSRVKTAQAPKLFSQSQLQNYLSKRYGFSPDKTLSKVQALYEKGFVSYPRTPTEYLATAEKDKVKGIIHALNAKYPDALQFKDKKSIFDDSKIESHSAITPTNKIPSDSAISDPDELKTYEAIRNRFMAVFCKEECLVKETVIEIQCGDETFKLKGNVIQQKGWKQFETHAGSDKDTTLPDLKIGDKVNTLFKEAAKETKPPKHYTVTTLNNWMKNPFKKSAADATGAEDEEADNADEAGNEIEGNPETDDSDDYKAILAGLQIGTEATRPDILKKLRLMKVIEVKKSTYYITPEGEAYIDALDKLKIDMSKERTAYTGKLLKDVSHGDKTVDEAVAEIGSYLKEIFKYKPETEIKAGKDAAELVVAGKCPICGKPVVERKKSWQCSSNKFKKTESGEFVRAEGCGFSVQKEILKKKITKSMVRDLCEKGRTNIIDGFVSSRSGKKFSAALKFEEGKVNLTFD